MLYLLDIVTALSLYHHTYLFLSLVIIFGLRSVCPKYGYTHFFFFWLSFAWSIILYPIHLDPVCVFIAEMSVLSQHIAGSCFFNSSNHSGFWLMSSICSHLGLVYFCCVTLICLFYFVESTCKWKYTVFVFLYMIYLT